MLRATLLGLTGFVLLCAAAILIGQQQETPEFFRYLRKCDVLPCYLCIVPVKTTWDDTNTLLENTSGMSYDSSSGITYEPPGYLGTMQIFPGENGLISELDLVFHDTNLNIGQIITELGSPCALELTVDHFSLIYPGISVMVSEDKIGTDQVVTRFSLVREINLITLHSCKQLLSNLSLHHWNGFGRYIS